MIRMTRTHLKSQSDSTDPLGDLMGALMGAGGGQPQDNLGGFLEPPDVQGGQVPQGAPDLGGLLGSLLGGAPQSGAVAGGGIGDLLGGMLGGGSPGDPGDALGGMLGGLLGGAPNAAAGGGLGGLLGAGAVGLLLSIPPFSGMIDGLSDKVGIPPAAAKAVIAFALTKLLAGLTSQVGGAPDAEAGEAPQLERSSGELGGFLDQTGGQAGAANAQGLINQVKSDTGVSAAYLSETGMIGELAEQTGLDEETAGQALQGAFTMIGEQLPLGG